MLKKTMQVAYYNKKIFKIHDDRIVKVRINVGFIENILEINNINICKTCLKTVISLKFIYSLDKT